MLVDIVFEDPRWEAADLTGLADGAASAVIDYLALTPPFGDAFEISLLACDDARIAVLNGDFRDRQSATNVLSWPSEERAADNAGGNPIPPEDPELGDIAIAYDTCLREAGEQGKEFPHHVSHLLVHGVLHLLGYDHINDKDACLMEGLEVEILGKMNISNPYEK
ncbi:probable rRNA maturation factor [Aliiroseovarius halocynthiae]|uniref:Endoribonuclease YbeY n=1 Tax=Aliiroseovarius halocynthiae TaxID=985055 RepID=A0A545SYF3_9RHOB|nr:rRNA maturation RNase YbeY [Aliiroseovarius halocynthiae]TQV69994.1 rRNA maturation RNase YbeY [Aliiroseovarius halocynthiae]SMR70661.1 probable rRNA maturation factor [Aliiroseovarius halocynthiae]